MPHVNVYGRKTSMETLVLEYLRTKRDLQLLLNFKISWIFNYQLLGPYIDLRIHGDLVNDYRVL